VEAWGRAVEWLEIQFSESLKSQQFWLLSLLCCKQGDLIFLSICFTTMTNCYHINHFLFVGYLIDQPMIANTNSP